MRPGCLGIDVILRDRGNAAPVIDTCADKLAKLSRLQIWRSLHHHLGWQDQPCGGDRPQVFIEAKIGRIGHQRIRLGAEILDDHFLDMAIAGVQVANGQQGFHPLQPGFSDTDQQPGGERHFRFARIANGAQADLGILVRRSIVRHPPGTQPVRRAFQHQSHGCRNRAQAIVIDRLHDARIQVRQQAGLFQHQRRYMRQVIQRAGETAFLQPLPGCGISRLRLITQSEQCLPATALLARTGNLQHFFRLQERRCQL